jgi:hypothetical protein
MTQNATPVDALSAKHERVLLALIDSDDPAELADAAAEQECLRNWRAHRRQNGTEPGPRRKEVRPTVPPARRSRTKPYLAASDEPVRFPSKPERSHREIALLRGQLQQCVDELEAG